VSRSDPETEEYLRGVVEYQASFIKDQAERIHSAVNILEDMSLDVDETTILDKIEEVTRILLYGKN
jgi:hypothetical protein